MNKTIGLRKTAALLKELDNVLIFTHERPDFDTIGSAMALKYALNKLGKKAGFVCPDTLPDRFSLICDNPVTTVDFKPDFIICVDMASEKMLGKYRDEYGGKIFLSIDHHLTSEKYAKYNYCRADASSAGEIVYDIVTALGIKQNKTLATYLYCAISSDSGCFKFSCASAKTHTVAAKLLKTGIDHAYLDRMMLDIRTESQLRLEELCLRSLRFFGNKKIAVMAVTIEMCEKSGASVTDIDALVQLPRTVAGVEVGITFKEQTKGKYKVSTRSNDYFDCSAFAENYGGGGHARAAGFVIDGDNLDMLIDSVAKKAEESI